MKLQVKTSSINKSLLGLILLCYIAGSFHHGILEIAHAISHHFTGGYTYHSHHHDLEDPGHEHTLLHFSTIASDQCSHLPIGQDNRLQIPVDKMSPIDLSAFLQKDLEDSVHTRIHFYTLQLPPTPYLQVATPPPEFTV